MENQQMLKRQLSSSSSSRPVSRRGDTIYEELSTPSPVGMFRPGTGLNRIASTRPSTSSSSMMRPIGTATRLSAASSSMGGGSALVPSTATSQRIGTALGYAGNMISERPLTQQGISGLPTTSSGRIGTASGMRQIKDKRYWQAQLQMKMNEIAREIEKLVKEKDTMDREQSARRTFEKKVKEATKELTNYQSKLTDMNIVLDSHSTGLTRQQIQQETVAIRERNENVQLQLENLFSERQIKEEQNQKLEKDIVDEKNKLNEMIYSLSETDQKRYHTLQTQLETLRNENTKIHDEIEIVLKQKDRLESMIMTSQSRLEAARLLGKLNESVAKRNALREEEANRLSPAQEREKLIAEVRANNQALQQISRQMKLIEDQLIEKREQLQQIEQDLDEGASDRHAKYKELKRRDETMNAFMDTFPHDMITEKQNIETLKNQITYAIEQITLQGINLKATGGGLSKSKILDEKNDLSSHDGLLKEYKKLSIQLKQLQILEKRTRTQFDNLKNEENQILDEIEKFNNLEALRADASRKMEEYAIQMEDLKNKKRVTEAVVAEARKRNENIKEELRSNETYRQISHLEEKLTDLLKENKALHESLDQIKKEFDYKELQKQSEDKLQMLMEMLRIDNKN